MEQSVREYLDVIHEVRELRQENSVLRRDVNQLRLDVGRAVDAATYSKGLLIIIAKKLGVQVDG